MWVIRSERSVGQANLSASKAQVGSTGADCSLQYFLFGFAPNVICHYPSTLNSTEHVIFSAHYDSRGSFGSTRAPGGDDDGSGSGHLLSLARAISNQGIVFEKAVTLAFFAGEEQGLLGSHAYAGASEWHCRAVHRWLRLPSTGYLNSQNATVLLQVQADMLGYHAVGIIILGIHVICWHMISLANLCSWVYQKRMFKWWFCSHHSRNMRILLIPFPVAYTFPKQAIWLVTFPNSILQSLLLGRLQPAAPITKASLPTAFQPRKFSSAMVPLWTQCTIIPGISLIGRGMILNKLYLSQRLLCRHCSPWLGIKECQCSCIAVYTSFRRCLSFRVCFVWLCKLFWIFVMKDD